MKSTRDALLGFVCLAFMVSMVVIAMYAQNRRAEASMALFDEAIREANGVEIIWEARVRASPVGMYRRGETCFLMAGSGERGLDIEPVECPK